MAGNTIHDDIGQMLSFCKQRISKIDAVSTNFDKISVLEKTTEDILRTIRHLRNQVTPLNRLPSELLCAIFGFVGKANAVRLSHVCQLWRNVALSYPALWSSIVIHNSVAYDEHLIRSAGATLDIIFKYKASDGDSLSVLPDLFRRLEGRCDRIVTIHIDTNIMDPLNLLPYDFPGLERLTWISSGSQVSNNNHQISSRSFPSLRTLVLDGLPNWPADLFNNLTEVKFRDVGNQLQLSHILDSLSRSALLESLSIIDCNVVNDVTLRTVELTRLTNIVLQNCKPPLLSYLLIPSILHIYISSATVVDAWIHTTSPILVNELVCLKVVVTSKSNRSHYLCGTTVTSCSFTVRVTDYWHGNSITVDVGDCVLLSSSFLMREFTLLRNIRFSQAMGELEPPERLVKSLFERMPHLEIFDIAEKHWEIFLRSLLPRQDDSFFCRDLKEINVMISSSTYEAIFKIIFEIVKSRAEAGRQIRCIRGVGSGADDEVEHAWDKLCKDRGIFNFLGEKVPSRVSEEAFFMRWSHPQLP